MDYQPLINYVFLTAMAVAGWLARELWGAIKASQTEMSKLRENMPIIYVLKEDYRRDIYDMKAMLVKLCDRIEKIMDQKL